MKIQIIVHFQHVFLVKCVLHDKTLLSELDLWCMYRFSDIIVPSVGAYTIQVTQIMQSDYFFK